MMRVPDGQLAVTVNNSVTGERRVNLADATPARH
jgi:hypothetical protein